MSLHVYRLEVFGAVRLLAPNGEPVALSPRALAYLVTLRLRGSEQLRTSALSNVLWSTKDGARAAASLNTLRKEVGRVAPGLLKRHDRGHRFEAEVLCDADELAGVSLNERITALRILARGFLRDFPAPEGADAFKRWAKGERERYRTLFVEQWEELAGADPTPPLMVTLGETGLEHDAAWTRAAVLLVGGLVRGGQQTEAEAAARRFVQAVPDARAAVVAELNIARPARESDGGTEAAARGDAADASKGDGAEESYDDGQAGSPRDSQSDDGRSAAGVPESAPVHPPGARQPSRLDRRIAAVLALALIGIAASAVLLIPRPCAPEDYAAQVVSQDYQPGAEISPGQSFTKGWRLRNIGRCPWKASFYLHFEESRQDGAPWKGHLSTSQADVRLGRDVLPGGEFPAAVPMTAPTRAGSYEEFWSFRDERERVLPVGGSISLAASISILPERVALCRPGEARDTFVAPSVNPRRSFRPGERLDVSVTFRNFGACTWPGGSRLSLDLPPEFLTSDSSVSVSRETIRPKRTVTYRRELTLPTRPGSYVVGAALVDAGGSRISSRSWPVHFRIGRHDPFGGYKPCASGEAGPRFVAETVADNSIVAPGREFEKVWTLTNASPGLCAWLPGVILRRASGASLSLVSQVRLNRVVLPGEVVTFSVPMRAPEHDGVHREDWELVDWTGRTLEISQTPTIWTVIIVPPPAR